MKPGRRRAARVAFVLLVFAGLSLWMAMIASAGNNYVGHSKCRACHLQQFKTWQQTRMARAYELLKSGQSAEAKKRANLDPNKDYTKDATCLACHTTGYGQPGGFRDIASTPDLAGVGCEVCHGPGGGYLKPSLMSLQNKQYKRSALVAAGLVIPSKQVCETCHNPKSPFMDPKAPFDFEQRKQQGTHQHLPLQFAH